MSLTQDTIHKLIAGVGTAALVALGGSSISNMVTNAKQDTQIEALAETVQEVRTLRASLEETNTNVLILNAKKDAEKEYRDVPRD
jgi:hypothetical protein